MKSNRLHLKAPGNWINDPNGFIYYKGKYHLFYQHFPFAPVWGTMHWGHAVSEDLIHWEHLDVALFPTKEYDQNGVFSGSALEVDGKLYLYYSAVRYLESVKENIHVPNHDNYVTSQAMIVSDDGFHFDNWKDKKKILPVNHNDDQAHPTHTRDPKVWKEGDTYYMILGSTFREQKGRIVFLKSQDGIQWDFVTQMQDERFGKILECPDIFRIDKTYVFMGSAMYIGNKLEGYENLAICSLANFDAEQCTLTLPEQFQYVDYGFDLYAPQTNLDEKGRRVMIGWMRMPKSVKEKNGMEWNGMMCLPRVVEVEDGHICFRIHPEVKKYFNMKIYSLDKIDFSHPFYLKTSLKEGKNINIGGYRIWLERGSVFTDRSEVFVATKGYSLVGRSPEISGGCKLDIFVEKNLIEIFINDGEFVISHVVYDLGAFIEISCLNSEEILCYSHDPNRCKVS